MELYSNFTTVFVRQWLKLGKEFYLLRFSGKTLAILSSYKL